jgi:type IV pilus assembly protein PilY1
MSQSIRKVARIAAYCVLAAAGSTTWLQASAQQLPLSQSPAGSAREPAPNVIVSVDDSNSMGTTGIATLKSALTQTFSASNVEDGRIRLAWQSMNGCNNFSGSCSPDNRMKPLQGTHRSNFMTWVSGIGMNGGTPGHLMMFNAGEYLKGPLGTNSPWADQPGAASPTYLSCRKSFHIYMTDGAHNSGFTGKTGKWSDQIDTSGSDGGARIAPGGNSDGRTQTLPDGTVYDITSPQTQLYRDSWGVGTSTLSTLSDLAFHYWSTDLQPSLTDNVRMSPKTQWPAENFGSGTSLTSYWNPRNNPATWQHMVTYSIGFDPDGSGPAAGADAWTGSPTWGGDTFANLGPLISGAASWPSPFCGAAGNTACDGQLTTTGGYNFRENQRKTELWHMALNSRGRFIPAPNADALVTAFQGILSDILKQTANPMVSIATASTRLRANDFVYIAGYQSDRWSGQLGAYAITAGTNVVASSPTWVATTYLDASTSTIPGRLIATSNITGTAARSFVAGSLTSTQLTLLGSTTTIQNQVINYVRGDRSQEVQYGGSLRNRDSRLGDIVNSNIWLTGKPARLTFEHNGHANFRSSSTAAARSATLYVGANDGMLHAFAATTGTERFAYIPRAALSNLSEFSLVTYGHRYFVDGHPFTGDVDVSYTTGTSSVADRRTVLVSGLGAGGRGYFVLDVTNPDAYNSSNIGSLVIVDKTLPATTPTTAGSTEAHDLGHVFATPVVDPVSNNRSEQIVKLNNGRWAVLMGNGVNSANERPVLLIQYLDGSKELLRIVADSTTGQGNGLSAPRPLDIDGNGTADVVYAGDLKGKVWKFDLSHGIDTSWGVAKFSGTGGDSTCKGVATCVPLFQATDGAGNTQAITTAPLWMAHPQGGIQVLVGTGINVTDSHRSNTSTQTIYSVWDKARYTKPAGSAVVVPVDQDRISASVRTMLVTQTVASAVTSTLSGATTSTDYFNTSQNEVTYSWTVSAAKRGWFMDLPASRERVINHPQIYEGQKALISTHVPKLGATGETCDFDTVTEDNWINVLNMISGKPSSIPVFSVSDTTMNLNQATRTRIGSGEYITINRNDGGKDLITLKDCGEGSASGTACTENKKLNTSTVPGARADWREIR